MIDIYYYDGAVHSATATELESLKDKRVWVDITNITREEAAIIRKAFDLHPLTEEDIYNTHVRIKIEEFPHYLFCAFYGIRKGKTIEPVELDFVLGEHFIISNHERDIPTYNELKSNPEKLLILFEKGCEFVYHKLLEDEIDHYYPVLETLDQQIEQIEEEVTKNPTQDVLIKILRLKRQIIQVKKNALPQRDKLSLLAKEPYRFISERGRPYFRDIYDHAVRVSDTVENYREALTNTFEAYMSAVSNRMSSVMKLLSIIATLALPLTVISGIYGTNFSHLPGSDSPYGFWVMIALMVGMSTLMIYYFRSNHWF